MRSHWFTHDKLRGTADDFERAVVLLVGFSRTLTATSADPYR